VIGVTWGGKYSLTSSIGGKRRLVRTLWGYVDSL
jgi:hypothetical protein